MTDKASDWLTNEHSMPCVASFFWRHVWGKKADVISCSNCLANYAIQGFKIAYHLLCLHSSKEVYWWVTCRNIENHFFNVTAVSTIVCWSVAFLSWRMIAVKSNVIKIKGLAVWCPLYWGLTNERAKKKILPYKWFNLAFINLYQLWFVVLMLLMNPQAGRLLDESRYQHSWKEGFSSK